MSIRPIYAVVAVCGAIVGVATAVATTGAPRAGLALMNLIAVVAVVDAWHPPTRAWLRADDRDRFFIRVLAAVILVADGIVLLLIATGLADVPIGSVLGS